MILAFALAFVGFVCLAMWGMLVLADTGRATVRQRRMGLEELHGFLLHPKLFYHPGHMWIMPQGNGTVRVGLDDFGRRLVDGIRKVALPPKGALVRQGRAAVRLDCGSKHAELLSPVDGEVMAVNDALSQEGSALEEDPYGKGWLFTAKVSDQRFTRLPTGTAAMEWLRRETGRLSLFFHDELGVTLADGGELIQKPPATLSDDHWQSLVRTFLAAEETALGGNEPPARGGES